MVSEKLSPLMIANAWLAVRDEWIVRRNKAHGDGRQWEVLHSWGDPEVVDDATQAVVDRFATREDAHHDAWSRERMARGQSVIDQIKDLEAK